MKAFYVLNICFFTVLSGMAQSLADFKSAQSVDQFEGEWTGTLFQEPNGKYAFELLVIKDTSKANAVLGVTIIKVLDEEGTTNLGSPGDYGALLFTGSVEGNQLTFKEVQVAKEQRDTTENNYYWCKKQATLTLSEEDGKKILRGNWDSEDKTCSPGTIYLVDSKSLQIKSMKVPIFATATLLEKTFEDMELEYTVRKYNSYSVKVGSFTVLLTIDDDNLIARSYFNAGETTLEQVNAYNREYRWARAYFDRDGDLTLADELSFTGGISTDKMKRFITRFGELLSAFVSSMQE